MILPCGSKKTDFENKVKKGIKLHTIREDAHKCWRPGMKIHFATGVRSLLYNNFKMGVCKSIQDIEIDSNDKIVWIDGRELSSHELDFLSDNDGFDCIGDFWGWFSAYPSFKGRLIHWTDLKYEGTENECGGGAMERGLGCYN